jgi:5'/3'-nucleotidase SurE
MSSMTASGHPAMAVSGFPADAVLFGVLEAFAADPPDLVVSGINAGQNMTAELVAFSGTVGAASWAARLGVPAFAASAAVQSPDYTGAARYTGNLVERFRRSRSFRRKMHANDPPVRGVVLNINYPTCTAGSAVRGARIVATGRMQTISGYTLVSETGSVQLWQPAVATGDLERSDCSSTLARPLTDIEAWNNGFVAVSPLDAERSVAGRRLRDFRFVERLF